MKNWTKRSLMVAGWLVLAGLLALPWLATHHVVQTREGTVVVPKRFVGLAETRVDIRGWDWDRLQQHAALRDALVQAGYADVLPQPRGWSRLGESVRRLGAQTGRACVDGANRLADDFASGLNAFEEWAFTR